jgi:uncharacterized protein YqgC (DUF456 family)
MKVFIGVMIALITATLAIGNMLTFDMEVIVPGVLVACILAGLKSSRSRGGLKGVVVGAALGVLAGLCVSIGLLALVFKPN